MPLTENISAVVYRVRGREKPTTLPETIKDQILQPPTGRELVFGVGGAAVGVAGLALWNGMSPEARERTIAMGKDAYQGLTIIVEAGKSTVDRVKEAVLTQTKPTDDQDGKFTDSPQEAQV